MLNLGENTPIFASTVNPSVYRFGRTGGGVGDKKDSSNSLQQFQTKEVKVTEIISNVIDSQRKDKVLQKELLF